MAKTSSSDSYKELSSKIWYLVIALIIYRIGAHIPVPGVDLARLKELFSSGGGSLIQLFNMFSGGALSNASLLALGVAPYISASIIMQLMSHMYPPLQELRNQGSTGQKKISQYTRYLTLVLALVQGYAISKTVVIQGLILSTSSNFTLVSTVGLAAGALFTMWLGEQITEKGIGNGTSMLIFTGIAINFPSGLAALIEQTRIGAVSGIQFFLTLTIIIGLFALIVVVERAQRRIDIHYAKRNNFAYSSAQREYLPLKINMAGVIPAIFASAIITLLVSGFSLLSNINGAIGRYSADIVAGFSQGNWLYISTFSLLIILFSFFYTAMMFENRELADNLKKSNAFIQGMRPGKQTADYLDMVQERLTLAGATYVAFVCVLPSLVNMGSASGQVLFLFGGTSLLIAVVVSMDFITQVQSHVLSQRYDSLMKKANLVGGFNQNKHF